MRTRKAKDRSRLIQTAMGQLPCDLTIGNVMRLDGVRFMLENAKKSKLRQYALAPPCVPAVPGMENAGAAFLANLVRQLHRFFAESLTVLLQCSFSFAGVFDVSYTSFGCL